MYARMASGDEPMAYPIVNGCDRDFQQNASTTKRIGLTLADLRLLYRIIPPAALCHALPLLHVLLDGE